MVVFITYVDDFGYVISNFAHAALVVVEMLQAAPLRCLKDFGSMVSNSLERKQVISIACHCKVGVEVEILN